MPIEIGELITRVTIVDAGPGAQDEIGEQGAQLSQEALIQECVRQVLRILRKERER